MLYEVITRGDLTSESIFLAGEMGRARLVAREPFVAAGVGNIAAEVFWARNKVIEVIDPVAEGSLMQPGDTLMTVSGPVVDLLKAERVALNLVQRLSGIDVITSYSIHYTKLYEVRWTCRCGRWPTMPTRWWCSGSPR